VELVIGAIQMESRNHDVIGNLGRALPLVEQAVDREASLVCLPEFLPSGYIFDESAWEAAEKSHGPTVQWLAEHARRLNVTLGTSFVEGTGDGFRNTFVLVGPEGEYGRVYKQDVAVYENYFMEGAAGPHIIETPFARVGVGICYENTRSFLSPLMVEHDADILLQPHSCPSLPSFMPRWMRDPYDDIVRDTPRNYAEGLGIPVLFVNKCGPFHSPTPMFPYLPFRAPFAGLTAIADSDGQVLMQADKDPTVLVATVHLDPDRKTRRPLPARGNWVIEAPRVILWYLEFVGKRGRLSYEKNRRRTASAHRLAQESSEKKKHQEESAPVRP
jgi:N-carbamoylputrescine amidase